MKEMLQVNCFADADFSRLFSVEDPQDVTLVRSRTGYVLNFAGCPIYGSPNFRLKWHSQHSMQSI
eukprot:13691259-Ditylum_brightwellii.AAC.1